MDDLNHAPAVGLDMPEHNVCRHYSTERSKQNDAIARSLKL